MGGCQMFMWLGNGMPDGMFVCFVMMVGIHDIVTMLEGMNTVTLFEAKIQVSLAKYDKNHQKSVQVPEGGGGKLGCPNQIPLSLLCRLRVSLWIVLLIEAKLLELATKNKRDCGCRWKDRNLRWLASYLAGLCGGG
ncbi:hypothetical protein Hanom_Chr05g00424821 [Helianthus anomalus]